MGRALMRGLLAGCLELLLHLPAQAGTPVLLQDTTRSYRLGQYADLLVRPRQPGTADLTLAQIRRAPWANQFRPSTRPVPQVEQSAVVWQRVELRNAARAHTRWLLMSVGNEFDFYLVDPAGRVRAQGQVRAQQPFAATHVVFDRAYTVPLAVPPGAALTLYLASGNGLLRFAIAEQSQLEAEARQRDVGAALYFGIMLALGLYNLLLYFAVRDRSHLYYVLFVASFALLQSLLMGYLGLLLRAWWPLGVPEVGYAGLMSATAIFSILTMRAFLETRRQVPRLDRVLQVVIGLALGYVLAALLPALRPLTSHFYYLVPLTTVAGMLVPGVAVLRLGYRPARYYLAGWAVLMAAIVLFYLRTLGVVPLSFLTEYGVRMASALEVILISLGLADRINLARRDKELAQAEALAVAREKQAVQQ